MKITDPYSPTARANDSASPAQPRREQLGETRAAEDRPPPGPEALAPARLRVPLLQHRLHRAHDERQADEHEHEDHAELVEPASVPGATGPAPTSPSAPVDPGRDPLPELADSIQPIFA
jgi:hypothetical protein